MLLRRIFSLLQPVRTTALVAGLIVVFKALVEVLNVYFLSPAVTALASVQKTEMSLGEWILSAEGPGASLRSLLLWMLASQALLGLGGYLRSIWDPRFSMRAVFPIRASVFDSLQRANLSFYDRMSSGQIVNRAINDLQNVRSFLNLSVLGSLEIVASLGFYFTLLALRSPWLMLAALLPIPIWWWIVSRVSSRMQPLCRSQQERGDELMAALSENLSGAQVVRAFSARKRESARYGRLNSRLCAKAMEIIRLNAFLTPAMRFVGVASHILLFIVAAKLIHLGRIHVGDLMLLGATMAAILAKLQTVNQIVESYQKAIVSSARVFEIMDLERTGEETREAKPPLDLSNGTIAFEKVSFDYEGKDALREISAVIPGGKITALVGPTGSGKSTLAGLVSRFYDPRAGLVRVDGQDLRDVDLSGLRHQVGYVFQESFLFSQSVRDNILYGRTDVSEEMLRKAAEAAHAHEFIENLPNGYDTLLGEKGVQLSGGQRQRIALARALVYDPKILILDDAMAALDTTTEKLVLNRLDPLFEGRTVLLIAHRLSNIRNADHVLVMKDGAIVQAGTHTELLAQDGDYRDIVQLQLLNEIGNGNENDSAADEPAEEWVETEELVS